MRRYAFHKACRRRRGGTEGQHKAEEAIHRKFLWNDVPFLLCYCLVVSSKGARIM